MEERYEKEMQKKTKKQENASEGDGKTAAEEEVCRGRFGEGKAEMGEKGRNAASRKGIGDSGREEG
jgi:hypothetical protein